MDETARRFIMKINEKMIDDVAVLELKGALDCGSGDQDFQKVIEQLAKRGIVRVVINLKDISHLDTTCLGLLIAAHVRFQRSGGAVALLHTPVRVRQLLKIARLDHVFASFDREEAAIRAISVSVATR
jgi:anti-anti-sigma factor